MDLAERVTTLRRANGLSARQLGALAGVAATTINRIEAGRVSPSFDVAQTLLTVLGEPLTTAPYADTDAIAAARLAVDPGLPLHPTRGIERWWERWARIGLVDDAGRVVPGRQADLLFRAASVARLARRAGGVDCAPGTPWREVAALLRDEDIAYALTGDAAANEYTPSAGEVWPVLYVEDTDIAIDVTGLEPLAADTYGSRITLIPFDGVSEVGATEFDGLTVAARAQVALDCYGGVGRMPEQADALLEGGTL